MRPRYRFRMLVLGAVTMIATAGPALGQEPEARPQSASTAELEALYEARRDSARMRFSEADVRFVSGMIHHHAQALVMAGLAPTHGASPTIQTLAARITNAQKDEIAWMESWLEDREQPVPAGHVEVPNLTAYIPESDSTHAAGHHPGVAHEAAHVVQQMPGMLTPEQMRELDQARGPEFDRLFLTYMIQHHQGAVTMVDELFATDGAAQDPLTFKLASDVQVDQRTEIDRMQKMLSTGSLQRKRS